MIVVLCFMNNTINQVRKVFNQALIFKTVYIAVKNKNHLIDHLRIHLFPESKDAVVVTDTPEVFQLFDSVLTNKDLMKVCN